MTTGSAGRFWYNDLYHLSVEVKIGSIEDRTEFILNCSWALKLAIL